LKLDAPASPAPAAPITEPADDAGFDGLGDTEPEATPADDKPFDDEPFDAGVEANEEEDPKKFIEQLTGKLGQSLRKYTEEQGQPDFDLEKFAINSLLSATHTSEMDEEDKKDIIKKVNTAGKDDSEGSNMDDNNDNPDNADDSNDGLGSGDDSNDEFGGNQDEEGLEEYQIYENENIFLENPKKNNMFQDGSNDILDEMKPCWKGYKQVGMKEKGGKEVPNCVPVNEESKGLWANIHAKKERGESPAKPGDEDYPDKKQWNKLTKEGESESNNYMFWLNLKGIHDNAIEMLHMDKSAVDELMADGHQWALEHVITSKDDIEEVYHFLEGNLETDNMMEGDMGKSNNYMFWSSLKTIAHASGELLEMDKTMVDQILSDGHGWALDHIATSNDDMEEVYHFLANTLNAYDGDNEGGYQDEYGSVDGGELYEGKYDGKPLGKPMKGDVKKFKVYVKNKKGNVIKVNFGDPNMEIKRDDPERRKSFRARHKCAQAKDRTTPKYWSCKMWSKTPVSKMVAENLINSKKSSTFDKNYLVNKLHETFNQEDMKNAEPQTAPAPVRTPTTKPGETKPVQPTRRNKPFLPMPEVQPDPKAMKEEGANGAPTEGQIMSIKQARESEIILDVFLNGSVVPVTFERDDLIEQPLAYDESWVYSFVSLDAPDGKQYTINASYLGHPDTDLDFQEIDSTHVELA
jgi:hypothetical protein